MKFISGIKKEELSNQVKLKIPIYHRTSISFFNRSEVYYIYRTYESNGFSISELILTPIKPEIWHHIRKVTLNAIDSPGIINTITSKLRDLKINVNVEEALTAQIGAIHTIGLIIDISLFIHTHPNKYNTGDKVPQEAIAQIENELKALINPYTKQSIVYNDQVYIKELTFLESISNIPENLTVSKINEMQFHNCDNQRLKINSGKIELDNKIILGLGLGSEDYFYYTMFSDTEEKYIKILFFDPNQTVVFIDIFHQDVYGAIAKFTEVIHNDYQFNILASYSHQQMKKDNAHWFALVDVSNKKQEFFTETLDALKTAKYGVDGDKKAVLDVFLIETNSDKVPNDAILRFGQNRPTKDGEETSVYENKKLLLKKCLQEFTIADYKKSPHKFVREFNLHTTKSLGRLIQTIIDEQSKQKNIRYKYYLRLAIAILIPLVLLWGAMSLFPSVYDMVHELFKHAEGFLLAAVTIAGIYASHKILEKYIK